MTEAARCRFYEKLAFHTAPTLLGVKCANLITLSRAEFDIEERTEEFNRRAAVKGLHCRTLCSCRDHALLLIYSRKLLAHRLAEPKAAGMLTEFGYPVGEDPEVCLAILSDRIRQSGDFPHEIGIFLGYPLEDVRGFIENRGEKYKFCGCWKVYGSEEQARRSFACYEKCRSYLCRRLHEGADLYQALKIA